MPGELTGIRVVLMPAEIDLASAAQVRAALVQALEDAAVVVADMTTTTRCTLEGVQALLRARAAVAAAGAQLRLAAVSPAIRRVLERTGTFQHLQLYPSLDAARAAPVSPAAPEPGAPAPTPPSRRRPAWG